MIREVSNDDWNFDFMDELLEKDDIPDEVKKDVVDMKEKQDEVKERLKDKKKEVEEAIEKIKEFDDVIEKLKPWSEKARNSSCLNEPISTQPDTLKKQLKEVEVCSEV